MIDWVGGQHTAMLRTAATLSVCLTDFKSLSAASSLGTNERRNRQFQRVHDR